MIISFPKLGSHGRLANQLFQIAATLGVAERNGAAPAFPPWKYAEWFDMPPFQPVQDMGKPPITFHEQQFHYKDVKFPEGVAKMEAWSGVVALEGYFQSEKYFPAAGWRPRFTPQALESTYAKITEEVHGIVPEELFRKATICIHIRRGDYVGNPNYYQLPITYYISALMANFPEWPECNLVIASDDLPYCKVHFGCLPNAYFLDGFNEIETMLLASRCNHFILSNSSYSWWCAYMGEKRHCKMVHPGHMFAGDLATNDTRDFWPERWTRYQREDYKLPLMDMTFTIPVYHDHKDRKQNLDLCVCMLQTQFNTNIVVGEQGGNKFLYMSQYCQYMLFDNMKRFHRTRMLNQMALHATTPFVANWDCDVLIPPLQVYLAVMELRAGEADMIFPYDGRFARLPRIPWFRTFQKSLDVGSVGASELKGKRNRAVPESSVGGAVFFRRTAFIEGGMENENMVSFGPEDCERNDRFTMLGYSVHRTGGPLFHIDHYCGPDSSRHNPFFRANHAELEKIRKMQKAELLLYVATWAWRPLNTERTQVEETLARMAEWAQGVTGVAYEFKSILAAPTVDEVEPTEPSNIQSILNKVSDNARRKVQEQTRRDGPY